ncbi:type II toxin-antitoxin system Phd/YefM family antitoxin [Streptomyces tubercidicus]
MPSRITFTAPFTPRVRAHNDAYTSLMTERAVTVREARTHPADHINRAGAGPPAVITRYGVPVAAVAPIAPPRARQSKT